MGRVFETDQSVPFVSVGLAALDPRYRGRTSVDPTFIPGRGDEAKIFRQLVGQFGGPAFVRRAREVQSAWEGLLESCRRQREEWLRWVRLRLGTLHALAGSWDNLRPYLESAQAQAVLEVMHAEMKPELRVPIAPTTSPRLLRAALQELRESVTRFNERWLSFVHEVDLHGVNALREGYNRFYLLEKEMAVGSTRIARQHFQKLQPATVEDVLRELPLLTTL